MEKKETPQSSFASFDSFSFKWERKNVELKRIPLCPFLVFKFQKMGGWEDKSLMLQLYLVLTVHRALGLGSVFFLQLTFVRLNQGLSDVPGGYSHAQLRTVDLNQRTERRADLTVTPVSPRRLPSASWVSPPTVGDSAGISQQYFCSM